MRDAFLSQVGREPGQVAHALGRVDGATRASVVSRLQQERGNAYVQRLVAGLQRQAAPSAEASPTRPVATSLDKIADQASALASDPGVQVVYAGTPAELPPPGGVKQIKNLAVGAVGYTGIPNAAAFTTPTFATTNSVVTQGESNQQTEHYAEVQPTSAQDVTHDSYYPGPGDHLFPSESSSKGGGSALRYYYRVGKKISQLIQAGEQEHLDDAKRAFDLTYGLIAKTINALGGKKFGPAKSPYNAEQMAEAALKKQLPPQLGVKPADWVKTLDILLRATRIRDKSWHSITSGVPKRVGKKMIVPMEAQQGVTQIGEHPSEEVVNYPS